jgi:outer membrane protein TolC
MINKPQKNKLFKKMHKHIERKGNMSLAFFLLVLILNTFSTKITAQKQDNQTYNLSLQQCVDFACQHQVDVVNSQIDEQISQGKVNEILGLGLPQINGSFNYQDFVHLPTQLIPAEFFGGPAGSYVGLQFGTQFVGTADVSASQLLFDGAFFLGIKASKSYLELSRKNTTRTKIETIASVTKAYYSVLVADQKMTLMTANVERLKKLQDDTKAMFDNGFVEKIDLDRITVAYNNITSERDNVERLIALSYYLLKFQMGMDQNAILKLSDQINSMELINWEVKTDGFDFTKRIEYSIMEAQKTLGFLDVKRYKSGYYPILYAYSDLSTANYVNTWNITETKQKWYPTGLIGAKLTVPIFDGQQKHARVVQAELNLRKINNQEQNLQNALSFQVTSSKTNYDNSIANLKVQKDNITLAENIYHVTMKKYENGVGSNIEVITAQTDLKQAQDNYYQALFDAVNAKVDLDKALGNIK